VQVAAAFAPPPSRQGVWPAIIGAAVLFVLAGGAGLAWYSLSGKAAVQLPDQAQATAKEIEPAKPPETKPVAAQAPADIDVLPALAANEAKSPAVEPPPATSPTASPPADSAPAAPAAPTPAVPAPNVVEKSPPKLEPLEPAPAKKAVLAHALPPDEQKKVDAAIERGVRLLKAQQLPTGTWRKDGFHAIGYAALPALTLLECNVPAKDPVIQRSALVVRRYIHKVNDTYDLALALLFLDRLGDKSDRDLIRQIALRLVAAQTDAGGWHYECPILTRPEMAKLMLLLEQTRPAAAQMLSLPKNSKTDAPERKALPNGSSASSSTQRKPEADSSKTKNAAAKPKPPIRYESLSPNLQRLPIVNALAKPAKGNAARLTFLPMPDDNSNSQFAMLALWAARRHGVPTERTLALADKRYRSSQNGDGGWGYHLRSPTKSAMTGVGLLGLAVGHGSSDEGLRAAAQARQKRAAARDLLRDPAINDGLQAFAQYIGGSNDPALPRTNLYFLWTVERVAMLYNLPTIGNKDWYRWGVHILVPSQQPSGGWFLGGYPGADLPIDTSFALLFLKRSNLVEDLTRDLTFYLAITDPGSANKRK
jgi:hypothetical protein